MRLVLHRFTIRTRVYNHYYHKHDSNSYSTPQLMDRSDVLEINKLHTVQNTRMLIIIFDTLGHICHTDNDA